MALNFGNTPESKNFQDMTPYTSTPMGRNLMQELLGYQTQGPGNYGTWLQNTLSSFTPHDKYLLQQGFPIETIMRMKALQNGTFPVDASVYPYSDKYADQVARSQSGR